MLVFFLVSFKRHEHKPLRGAKKRYIVVSIPSFFLKRKNVVALPMLVFFKRYKKKDEHTKTNERRRLQGTQKSKILIRDTTKIEDFCGIPSYAQLRRDTSILLFSFPKPCCYLFFCMLLKGELLRIGRATTFLYLLFYYVKL